jgi:hypothetical protein
VVTIAVVARIDADQRLASLFGVDRWDRRSTGDLRVPRHHGNWETVGNYGATRGRIGFGLSCGRALRFTPSLSAARKRIGPQYFWPNCRQSPCGPFRLLR